MAQCALCLMAHPDDGEIFAGGTLALLAQKGWKIHIASMTPGDCGSREYSASDVSRMRRAEGAKAAALIGATYHCLDRRDLRIFYDDPTVTAAVELLRSIRPDVVFTHPPSDYMLDHEMTSTVTRAACFAASAPNYDTGRRPFAEPTEHIPHLYYASPASGINLFGEPAKFSVMVDTTEVIEVKAEMLACHESQRVWLQQQHGMDHYVEEMRHWSREMGKRLGVEHAEGFRQHMGHPYPQSDLLVETLGAKRV
ncbi:MAG: PIG-L family deacetylase [Bryobacterales bacterium]|nr:PIG-L family deacetylase [Acidobacteriota bacterium]MCB9383031.1 PIG-L family deacetylase [Bryobacterales bacterium]